MEGFYKNKTIFITGGSGFVGKVTIEKLLRSTDVKRIYVLIRPKKGQEVQDRIAGWKDEVVFSQLLKEKPEILERIVPISGDCKEPDLGISQGDRELLAREVQVVVHGAATVRFTEPLHLALDVNTRAARLMLELAKSMTQLEAFVHVSTAFTNCVTDHIKEDYYPEHLTCRADKVLAMRDTLSDELFDKMAPVLVGKYPNTYAYTKALAEEVLQKEAGDLPLCIYRPAIIVTSYKEPVEGWIDNVYGPTILLYGTALGYLRITPLNTNANANVLPVDYCVNLLLALAYRTAEESANRKLEGISAPPPTIYNYVPSKKNMLTWGGFVGKTAALANVFPFEQMIWLPFLQLTTNIWLFKVLSTFYHLVPGFLMDLALRLKGQEPRMIKMYNKFHNTMHVLEFFGANTWHFDTGNTESVWESLTPEDQELYPFDMSTLDWDDYFYRSTGGMRVYLGKGDPSPEGIKRAQRVRARYLILHRLLQLVLYGGSLAILGCVFKSLLRSTHTHTH
ncbi:hypothetical protein ACLKA7_005437 [Drosophila subpalustris]